MTTDPQVSLLRSTPQPEKLVCECARNDYYDGDVSGEDYKDVMEEVDGGPLEEKERNLMKKLMLRGHWGVFEHPHFTFHFTVSRACMAQITRHRQATFDVQSQRYVDFSNKVVRTDFVYTEGITEEKITTREGVKEPEIEVSGRKTLLRNHYKSCVELYEYLVDNGVPKEDARSVLPNGIKVNVTMTVNARTVFHLIVMRGSGEAQAEIQRLADSIKEEMRTVMPRAIEIFEDNRQSIERQKLSP